MGGYTPAFASIYSGTLYGRWPTAAVWASLLPLIDSRGHIELSYEAISGMTGWPLKLLRRGIEALMEPDPNSSSKLEEGRRLVLIDPARPWGWRAVNVQKYRDKASGVDQVSDGRNADKVRRYKERHRRTPEDTGGTPRTPTHTHTHTQTQTREDKNQKRASAPVLLHESLPKMAWEEWIGVRRAKRWPCDAVTLRKQLAVLSEYDTESQREIIDKSINAGWQGLFPPKGKLRSTFKGAPTTEEIEAMVAGRERASG